VESQGLVQFGSTQKVSTLKADQVNLTILQKIYLGPGWGVIPFIKNILFLHPLTDEKANFHDLPHIKRGWLFVDFNAFNIADFGVRGIFGSNKTIVW